MKNIKLVIVGLICLCLCGCASFGKHFSGLTSKSDKAYLKARTSPKLKIPSGLSHSKVGDSYGIPYAGGHGKVPASIAPPGGVHKAKVPGNPQKQNKHKYFLKPIF